MKVERKSSNHAFIMKLFHWHSCIFLPLFAGAHFFPPTQLYSLVSYATCLYIAQYPVTIYPYSLGIDEWESSKNVAESPLLSLYILTFHSLCLIYYYCPVWKGLLRNYIWVKNQTITSVSIRTFPSVCGIGGSIYKDIEALKHVKASYFPFPPDPCPAKSFCKSEGNKAGKNTFSGAWGLRRNIVPLFWSYTMKKWVLFKHGKDN